MTDPAVDGIGIRDGYLAVGIGVSKISFDIRIFRNMMGIEFAVPAEVIGAFSDIFPGLPDFFCILSSSCIFKHFCQVITTHSHPHIVAIHHAVIGHTRFGHHDISSPDLIIHIRLKIPDIDSISALQEFKFLRPAVRIGRAVLNGFDAIIESAFHPGIVPGGFPCIVHTFQKGKFAHIFNRDPDKKA